MRPLKLTMQAFGSYGKKTVIDFDALNQNLFLITGDTGAGKTMIFDALVFALYGEASSGNNRKNGTELQSQFAGYEEEPYVELTFSEKAGGVDQIYTVRRVPRHVRPLKKGSGIREEKEKVSLFLPDGSEYSRNQKETDGKLEEIVGLTKNQFMQVAMIAQGEFMELLRAKSDDKKVIFRKLFHTEKFQSIVDELGKRRKEKLSDIAQIRTICQTEAGRVTVPGEDERADRLQSLQKKILSSDQLHVTDMEAFLEELGQLCGRLKSRRDVAKAEYERAVRIRDEKRDACTRAESLVQSYQQLEKAERELTECEGAQEEVEEAAGLLARIHTAYEIQAVCRSYGDARQEAENLERKLQLQQELLPGLTERSREAAETEAEAQIAQMKALERFTKVSERVSNARQVFQKIRNAEKALVLQQKQLAEAEEGYSCALQALTDFEERAKNWRKQADRLKDAAVLLELWEKQREEAAELSEMLEAARDIEEAAKQQRRKAEKAQQAYAGIRQKVAVKSEEYTKKQTLFLDAQAGFLAKEKLRPGEPCPVCGALEHPHPHELSEDDRELTRETLEALAEEVSALRQKQEEKSTEAGSALDVLREKEKSFGEAVERLRKRMAKSIQDVPEELSLEKAAELLGRWERALWEDGTALKKNARLLSELQAELGGAEKKLQAFREKSEAARRKVSDAESLVTAARTTLGHLEDGKEYPDSRAAEDALSAAAAARDEKNAVYEAARKAARETNTARENAEMLIRDCHNGLPERRKEQERRAAEYQDMLARRKMTEPEWQQICAEHGKSEADSLQEAIASHNRKKASAEGAWETAKKAIGDQARPVMEELRADREAAENSLQEAQDSWERLKEEYRRNREVYEALAPRMEERGRMTREFTRIDSLYNRLAGKVSGARMDIETFVQRYYLERILYAANIRFREMSAGQYELRMVGEDQAGEGKNRGLDLMVYSAVTGKADQIRESSASLQLDVMFIDEGFGTLDEHSRNQAVRVLKQMAGGSRMIGIISHVTELKQEIEDRLLVSKDDTGSHVRWQIS